MTGELSNDSVAKAYAQWARFAPIYDLVFGPALSQGRKDSIAAAERVGGRILDVGVGTGISLHGLFRQATAWSASTIPSRCCARRRSA